MANISGNDETFVKITNVVNSSRGCKRIIEMLCRMVIPSLSEYNTSFNGTKFDLNIDNDNSVSLNFNIGESGVIKIVIIITVHLLHHTVKEIVEKIVNEIELICKVISKASYTHETTFHLKSFLDLVLVPI